MTSLGLDSQGMADATAGLPEQVEDAAAAAQRVGELPDRADIANVLVLGMGGSGVGGGGGGRPDFAQAGGKNEAEIEAALAFARTHLESALG